MEKTCEFCGAPKPVVYCEADEAFLCLCCDAKVHSANALSSRHSRDLLCDSCAQNVAFVRCLDHSMLLCQGCDSNMHNHHGFPTTHRKIILRSFTGCPSAKHFGTLWGFNVSDHQPKLGTSTTASVSSYHYGGSGKLISNLRPKQADNIGSCSQKHKVPNSDVQEQNNRLIMQQILDLKKLQLSSANNQSSSKVNEGVHTQFFQGTEFLTSQPTTNERFIPSSMSQLDLLSSSSSVRSDDYWEHKTPLDACQFWSQNLLDLGVCEDTGSFDDLNMPDVDLSFPNFDDLFTNDVNVTTRPLLEEHHDQLRSNSENETSLDDPGNSTHLTTTTTKAWQTE